MSKLENVFPSSLMMRPEKLEHLSLETLSSEVLELEGQAEPTHLEHLSDASFLGKLLAFPANVILDWKVVASTRVGQAMVSLTNIRLGW